MAFAMAHYEMSERQACKLVDLNRSSTGMSRDRITMRNCAKRWSNWLGKNRGTAIGACTRC